MSASDPKRTPDVGRVVDAVILVIAGIPMNVSGGEAAQKTGLRRPLSCRSSWFARKCPHSLFEFR